MELTKKQQLFFKDVKTEHFTTEEIQHWKNKTAPTNLANSKFPPELRISKTLLAHNAGRKRID